MDGIVNKKHLIPIFLLCSLPLLLTACNSGSNSSTDQTTDTGNPQTNDPNNNATVTDLKCSTLDKKNKSQNCSFEQKADGTNVLKYKLTASMDNVQVPIESGRQPPLTLNDAMVYNGKLSPERIELQRGDEMLVDYNNLLPQQDCSNTVTTNCLPARFKQYAAHGHPATASNLHTHGLETPWDFKNSPNVRGDNILTTMVRPPGQTNYKHIIRADHEIGLNWYHPHPHGLTGFQVEGGLSGLLMIADAEAEQYVYPTYIQLKDMQTSKVPGTDNTYQFEKFVPPVATACHIQQTIEENNDRWVFQDNTPGRCNYHLENVATNTKVADYSWLFLVNGELFPRIDMSESAFIRLANNSANVTYRLMLEPEAVATQTEPSITYYTPAFTVIEKDGMSTTADASTGLVSHCSLTVTPATRVGFGFNYTHMTVADTVCKVTVDIATTNGKKTTQYKTESVAVKDLSAVEMQQVEEAQRKNVYNLVQQGLNTGEDDWPAVRLATLAKDEFKSSSNLSIYQNKLTDGATIAVPERTDVLEPTDTCKAVVPSADTDGINRHLAFFHGADSAGEEHFGLVTSGDLNEGEVVTKATIEAWRKEYQLQFEGNAVIVDGLLEYELPLLDVEAFRGIKSHKFALDKTNICTHRSDTPERWRIYNLSSQIHNFHIHQMKFKVDKVQGASCTPNVPAITRGTEIKAFSLVDPTTGYITTTEPTNQALTTALDEQCVKTYAEVMRDVPAIFKLVETQAIGKRSLSPLAKNTDTGFGIHDTFPVPPMGYIEIDISFDKAENVGEYVYHCHILEHEDAGMMSKIVVKSQAD